MGTDRLLDGRHQAVMHVSLELLPELLGLKPGRRVLHVVTPAEAFGDSVDIVIEHPDLKAVALGYRLPIIQPEFTRSENGRVTMTGWGQA